MEQQSTHLPEKSTMNAVPTMEAEIASLTSNYPMKCGYNATKYDRVQLGTCMVIVMSA